MNGILARILFLEMWTIIFVVCLVTLKVKAVGQLQFSLEPQDVVVVPGGSVVLDCVATSSLPGASPHIQWRGADGQTLSFIGDLYRSQLPNGSLYISEVLPERGGLAGDYQCLARLDSVGAIVSRIARIVLASFPQLKGQPADLRVFPGQTAHFRCPVVSTPPATVVWLKDGRPLRMDEARMLVFPSGSLELDEVQVSDQGNYRCNASSLGHFRLSDEASLEIDLDLAAGANIMAPVFIATPHKTITTEGSTITLDCAANGHPRPWVSWLKDGINIDMADLDSRFLKVGTGSLQISNVQEKDQGTYQCRAENRDDSVDASAALEVQVPPRFVRRPVDQVAVEKEDVELACEVYGRPDPHVHWLKNGDQFVQNDYLQLVNGYNLRILGVIKLDAGIFQCVAWNAAGNIQAAARLSVQPPGFSLPSSIGDVLSAVTPPPISLPATPLSVAPREEPHEQNTPSAPQEVEAVIVATRFVTLRWKPPAEPHGTILTYSVYYRMEGSARERVINTTGSRLEETNIPGLMPDRKYLFRVRGVNIHGAGESSETLNVSTKPEIHVPGPSTNLRAIATSATSLLVQWDPPETSNGPVIQYKMYYMQGDSAEEHHVVTTQRQYELTDLAKFTEYSVWVIALNQNGPGSSTEEIVARTLSDVPSAPPQNVTLEPSSSTSVIVRWEPPPREACNGVITGYKLRYRLRERRRGDTVTTAGDRRLLVLTGLERGQQYQVRLWALTVNGTGPPTDWLTVETFENDLDESRVPDPPSQLKARPMTDTISVTWGPPLNQNIMVRGYTIGWGKGIPDVYTQVLDGKTRFYVIEGLEPKSEYVISLRAYNEMGDGKPVYVSEHTREELASEPITPLIPPVGLQAVVLSSSTVVVYWTDTSLSKSQFVTDNRYYTVRYTSSHNSASPRYKYFNATDLNCMIDDLKPNTQYEFTVKVVKGRRESPWSMVVVNKTEEAAPGSQPRDLTVIPAEDASTSVNLNWQPPKLSNGAITGYVILYTDDKSLADRDWVVQGIVGDPMTTNIGKLKPDTTYFFKIQARNAKGYGPFSSVVAFTTGLASGKPQGLSPSLVLYLALGCVILLVCAIAAGLTFVCRRRRAAERSKKGYLKGKAKPSIKPPDLWIHHDQMELKALEKNQGADGPSGAPLAVSTLPRTGPDFESETAHVSTGCNSLDKRTYVSSYIGADEKTSTARRVVKPKPIMLPVDSRPPREPVATAAPLPGGQPVYPRTQYSSSRAHVTVDDSLQGGYDTVGAPQPGVQASQPSSEAGTVAKRLQGHPLKSFSVPAPPPQSAPGTPQPKHVVRPQGSSSPYKKAGLLAATAPPGPSGTAGKSRPSTQGSADAMKLQPSYSTEELNQEMANLEGLMKDLNAITASEFEC